MAGDDDETTPSERPGGVRLPRARGTGYSAQRPPQGRDVIATRPNRLPSVGGEDFGRTTPMPVMMGVPEPVDPSSDISAVSQRVDVAVRRAVATLPPPAPLFTKSDVAKWFAGALVVSFAGWLASMVTCGFVQKKDLDDAVKKAATPMIQPVESKVNAVDERARTIEGKVDKVYDLLLRRP